MSFEKLNIEETKLEKAEMSQVKGGTSTTVYTVVGYAENEYEDTNGNGKLDDDEAKQKPILVEFPDK